jgi:hypothetical protein
MRAWMNNLFWIAAIDSVSHFGYLLANKLGFVSSEAAYAC